MPYELPNKPLVPTRTGQAPVLAARRRRSALKNKEHQRMKRRFAFIAAITLCQSIFTWAAEQEEHEWQFTAVAGNSIAWSCLG